MGWRRVQRRPHGHAPPLRDLLEDRMSSIGTICRKELLVYAYERQIQIVVLMGILLTLTTSVVGSLYHGQRYEDYAASVETEMEERRAAKVYAELHPVMIDPPRLLSIFAQGVDAVYGEAVRITLNTVPSRLYVLGTSQTVFLRMYESVDVVTVLAFIGSLVAIMLGHGAMCGEFEGGTLHLLRSCEVSKLEILLGKLLAGSVAIGLYLAGSFATGLLCLLALSGGTPGADDWLRLGGLFLLSCGLLWSVLCCAMGVSSVMRSSASSLLLCLVVWLLWGPVYELVHPYAVRELIQESPVDNRGKMRELRRGRDAAVDQWISENPEPAGLAMRSIQVGQNLRRFGADEGYEYLAGLYAVQTELDIELAKKKHAFAVERLGRKRRQDRVAEYASWWSPFAAYLQWAAKVCGTATRDKEEVLERARTLRREYIASLRSRGIIGGRAWFTDDPPGTTPMFPDPLAELSPAEREARMEWGLRESDRVHDQRQLDLSVVPDLGREPDTRDAGRDLVESVVVIALLGVLGAAVLVACGAMGERIEQV